MSASLEMLENATAQTLQVLQTETDSTTQMPIQNCKILKKLSTVESVLIHSSCCVYVIKFGTIATDVKIIQHELYHLNSIPNKIDFRSWILNVKGWLGEILKPL